MVEKDILRYETKLFLKETEEVWQENTIATRNIGR